MESSSEQTHSPVPQLDLAEQHRKLWLEIGPKMQQAFNSASFVLGPLVEGFEQKLAGYCKAHYAVGMSSGTDALIAALMAMDIGPGDEVITTPFTFFATGGCVARVGATPVFVDIRPNTFNIDPFAAAAAVNEKTRAIMPVHLYGLPADMDPILQTARERNLLIIEDAAQAVGAKYGTRPCGSLGHIGCLSFYPTKNLAAAGDAGACLTNDEEIATKLKQVRLHGMGGDYLHDVIGGNFRLDSIQALILDVKIDHLTQWTTQRQRIAQRYDELLAGLPVITPESPAGRTHVFHQYTVRVLDGKRDALQQHLSARKIGVRVYYPVPLHLQPCFKYLNYRKGQLPHSEKAAAEVLSLPMFPELTEAQQQRVADEVRAFYASGA